MSKKNIPGVSVIIPMYNAEKYIGECLDSIFAQTFQDFEIIVVDNYSTDNSCKIVENFMINHGGGELKLIRRKRNSGGCSEPRNDGLKIASGEYIFFVDSDDLITKTALEELYNTAKKFSADVVCCEKFYQFTNTLNNDKIKIVSYQNKEFVTAPTLISENFEQRTDDLLNKRVLWNVWSKFSRHKFLTDNKIIMVSAPAEDVIFTVSVFCSAEKIVRVPNIVNLYRVVENSVSHKKDDVISTVKKWWKMLLDGLSYLDKFLNKQEGFKNRPDLKYAVYETVTREFMQYILPIYAQVPAYQLDEIIRGELESFDKQMTWAAFLFSRMNVLHVNLLQIQAQNNQLKSQLLR